MALFFCDIINDRGEIVIQKVYQFEKIGGN